jgi:hypothetical protein
MGGLLEAALAQLGDGLSMSSTVSIRSWPDRKPGAVMTSIVPSSCHDGDRRLLSLLARPQYALLVLGARNGQFAEAGAGRRENR